MQGYKTDKITGSGDDRWQQKYYTLQGDRNRTNSIIGDPVTLRAGLYGNPQAPLQNYFVGGNLPQNGLLQLPKVQTNFETPLGDISFDTSGEQKNSFYADYMPNANAYYVKALADMLMK